MLSATILLPAGMWFDVTIKSSFGSRPYVVFASSSVDAWEKAAAYCGDDACAITVVRASVQ